MACFIDLIHALATLAGAAGLGAACVALVVVALLHGRRGR
ncbi:hypothetical protein KOR34_05190 [Posidoniimonas corsicana]|uniref:Uncharacterized protein n=1 Tax=Posidoniimonas corsicana TaxID=1938618 RepID=A0A5C5VDA7_9BACT|nr:hypothetical protein KOR34_05190 [Posidoniimonas corsicana]